MAEKKETSYHAHKVVIQGTVEGYDVAPLENPKNGRADREYPRRDHHLKGTNERSAESLERYELKARTTSELLKGF